MTTLKTVVLPAPFGPIRPKISPSRTSDDAVERDHAAEAHGQRAQLQQRAVVGHRGAGGLRGGLGHGVTAASSVTGAATSAPRWPLPPPPSASSALRRRDGQMPSGRRIIMMTSTAPNASTR